MSENLETFRKAKRSMPRSRMREFHDYFIGAVSVYVPGKLWAEAINTAAKCVEADIRKEQFDCPIHGRQDGPGCVEC